MEFDKIQTGISGINREKDGQISILEYDNSVVLPDTPKIEKTPRKKKSAGVNKKEAQKNIIHIDDIKVMKESDKYKKSGTGVLNITGVDSDKVSTGSFVRAVSEKTTNIIKERNMELEAIRKYPYIKRDFILTEAEKKLYRFLKLRIDKRAIIMTKIRLADIVDLNSAISRDQSSFYKIAYKHVDFVILDDKMDLICVVELDDYTHNTAKAQERDKFVQDVMVQCGIPFYRVGCKIDLITSEDTKSIENCVLEYFAPICPVCGRPMEPKEKRYPPNKGHRFYGCKGFFEAEDKCNYTIDID